MEPATMDRVKTPDNWVPSPVKKGKAKAQPGSAHGSNTYQNRWRPPRARLLWFGEGAGEEDVTVSIRMIGLRSIRKGWGGRY